MNDSSAGYFDQIDYTYGYCDELNPLRAALPLLLAGYAWTPPAHACELGFGHGVSVNMHAAASTARWHGTDFNANQAGFAQDLAARSGAPAQLAGERFAEFCARGDLPDFDYIGMHGLWTWISAENRACIIDFIARKLKPGGVLYVSYNALPGWSAMLPVRELMYRHFDAAAATQADAAHRIRAAVAYAQTVFAARPNGCQPGAASDAGQDLAERVRALANDSFNYLAHEYFNRDWHPMPFGEVAALLDPAGLTYAGSAHYRDHLDELNLTPRQRALVSDCVEPVVRETVRDLCVNQSFRRDYWVKGGKGIKAAATLDAETSLTALRAQRVVLALPRQWVQLKARGALGEASLPHVVYGPILDVLAHHQPMSLGELESRVGHLPFAQMVRAVMLLISIGALLNAQEDATIAEARPTAARLNAAICERARTTGDVQFLASPVSGSAIRVPRVAQLFLCAQAQGLVQPAQWAEFAGQALQSADMEAVPGQVELVAQAQRFATLQLPILRKLGVA